MTTIRYEWQEFHQFRNQLQVLRIQYRLELQTTSRICTTARKLVAVRAAADKPMLDCRMG